MLIATIICYNDWPLIQQTIESIIDKVDKIICVDGAYDEFPCDINYSTDGTLEYLDSLDKVELIIAPGLAEVAKRNLYLDPLIDGDTVLNIDADEILIGEIPNLTTDFCTMDWCDDNSKHVERRVTKLFRYHENMRYVGCHYTLYTGDGIMINKLHEIVNSTFSSEYTTSCKIIHYWNKRSDERKYQKEQYYKLLVQKEAGFIK